MKRSQIDRAIDHLEQEINVLVLAVAKLKEQRDAKPKRERKPRLVEKGAAS